MKNQHFDSFNFNRLGNTFLQPITEKWNHIVDALIQQMLFKAEPKVYSKLNGFGETVWHVYDPLTGCETCMGSETEVRAWLDRRYY